MAKEDFCFTYYDGDAARDKAHMTRLCRGAYDDFISMQRKVGHLSIDVIQMVLSSDFDLCWKSLLFILKQDQEGKYFIEWVDKSINKMKENAGKQRKKALDRWEKQKASGTTSVFKKDTTVLKYDTDGVPIIVNENGYVNEDYKEEGEGEGFFLNEISMNLELTKVEVNAVREFIQIVCHKTVTDDDVGNAWKAFKIDNFKNQEWYGSHEKLLSHFRHTFKNELNKSNGSATFKNSGQRIKITGAGGY